MEAIHKLKVYCPYDIVKIENIKISCKPNEHGYLYLKCLIDDSIKFKYSIEASTEDKIMLYEELEGKEKSIIFTGIIENVRTTNENGIYYLELEAASSSSILDKEEKTRSFQDAEMSYDDLINEVLKSYKDISLGFTQRMDRPMSIGKPLFQYKETDYEFLKRVASLLGLDLVCDIIKYGNAFYFGRPLGEKYKLEDDISYKACKDLERYHKAVTRGFDVDFHDTDFFYYEIENHTKMDIGDQIYFKQKDLYVNQFEAELHKGELIYKYRFCRESGIWQDKLYNEKIRGRSIEGEVLETDGEKLKLHLYVDESQEPSKAAWFYYAPPSGNILYSMPIVGESAILYFQDEVDSDPIVTGCVRKNGSTCEQMSDTADRYFATETGDYLDILPGAINLHRDGLNVNFTDGGGITFSSSGNLSISGGSVSLSGGSVAINATSQIKVQKGKSSYISAENEFYTQANTVYENGSVRDSYAAFTDDEPTAGAAEAKQKLEQQIKHAEFKEQQLMEAMHGSEATTKDASPSSDNDNSSDDNLPEFNQYIQYENGAKVKYQSYDGSFVSGTAYNGTDLNSDPISVFVPDDRDSYNEHNSEVKTVASRGLSALNWIKENVAGIAKLSTYTDTDYSDGTAAIATDVWGDDAAEYFNSSKELREEGEEECREYIDGVSSNVNDYLREKAPYKYQYDEFGKVLTIAQIILTVMDAGVGVVKLIEDSPKFIEDGAKVVNDLSKGDKASEVLEDEIKIAKGEDDYSVTDDADYQKTGDTDTSTPESKDVDTSGTEAQNESVSSTKTEDTDISNAETGPESNEGGSKAGSSIDYVKLSEELGTKIETDGYKVINTETAEQANVDWADMGFNLPPVAENTTVYNVEAGDFSYSRVYLEGYNRPVSNFVLRTEDIEGLSAEEIAQKYALSKVPDKIVTVELPSDTPLEVSIVGPQESWGTLGGDVQYAIKDADLNPSWFENIQDLK